jgi:hypothetical protein
MPISSTVFGWPGQTLSPKALEASPLQMLQHPWLLTKLHLSQPVIIAHVVSDHHHRYDALVALLL